MARPKSTGVQDPSAFVKALQDRGRTLRAKYKGKPFDLAARLGVKLPEKPVVKMIKIGVLTKEEAIEKFGPIEPGIRELVEDLCLLKEDSAVAVATRGGGKSQSASFVEFYLVFVESFDALNLGGSEFQAQQVYSYLVNYIESDPFWKTLIKTGEPQQERTDLKDGNWIQILAASSKSTRSRHAGGGGGKQRGGFLAIDEEAEAEPEHVNAALHTINTADPSVNLRCSTFHKAVGTFKELVDKHKEMGYKLYRWTIFDVAKPCDCPLDKVGCQSEEKCFREDHVEKYIDPETGAETERVVHKAYCGGVAKYSDGWIPMKTILSTWRRMGRSHSQWEVEAMGSRPTSSGFVIKDQTWHAKNTTTDSPASLYREGFPLSVLVDWGCHDDQTEILTEMGWKLFKDVVSKDKVAQFNKESKKISFVVPEQLTVRDYEGELVRFTGRSTDIMVTPNHRMLVRSYDSKAWKVRRADEVENMSRPYGTGSLRWVGREKSVFTLPGTSPQGNHKGFQSKVYLMDDWVELLGYFLSEGGLCWRNNKSGPVPYCVKMSQRGLKTTIKMRNCMDRLEIPYSEFFYAPTGDTNWTICGKQWWGWWRDNIGEHGHTKRIPRQFMKLSWRQLLILFSALMAGDGNWCPNEGSTSGTYSSTSYGLCSDVQELAIRLGYRATVRLNRKAEGNRRTKWVVQICEGEDRMLANTSRVKYSGKVYCCTVPEEFIITRRNGCVAFQGNTTAAGLEVWQEQVLPSGKERHVLLECDQVEEAGINQIVGAVMGYVNKYRNSFVEVAADIGGGGNYLNPYLRDMGVQVRDVNFNQEKEAAAAAWNILNEGGKLAIPSEFLLFHEQVGRWRRTKVGKIDKGNDHLCDAAICYFSKFIERMGLSHIRIVPVTFSSGQAHSADQALAERMGVTTTPHVLSDARIPVVVTLGGNSR